MTMMKPDERRAMRRQQTEQFLASDMGVMEWTKLNRMSTSTFYLWLHRFQDEDPETFGRREPKGGGWIELSRAELRDSVALAKADDPAPAAPVVAAAAPIPAPTPTIAPPSASASTARASRCPQVRRRPTSPRCSGRWRRRNRSPFSAPSASAEGRASRFLKQIARHARGMAKAVGRPMARKCRAGL